MLDLSQIEPGIRGTGTSINWVLDEFNYANIESLNKNLMHSSNVNV